VVEYVFFVFIDHESAATGTGPSTTAWCPDPALYTSPSVGESGFRVQYSPITLSFVG